jgi:putative transposase
MVSVLKDARLAILDAARKFRAASASAIEADKAFCLAYNTRNAALDDWVYEAVRRVSPRTLRRWRGAIKADATERLAATSRRNRQGTACLTVAESGRVETYITALLVRQPYLTADQVRLLVAAEFGEMLSVTRTGGEVREAALPSLRTFSSFLAGLRERSKHLLLARTDPDRYKSSVRIAGQSRDHITRLNELWEIDASPADVLTKDGRHSLYVLIDVYSRRMMTLVTKTPRAEAVLLLIRRAILAWGVPEQVRTDQGSDFTAVRVRRAFAGLGIAHDLCAPFSPEQKGVVERAIRTVQHDLMPLIPGFIGHNVAQRKQIEARRAFAQRLGETDDKVFCVDLTAADLQTACDRWCAGRYAQRVHAALGISPFRAAAEYAGPIRQIEDQRALDLLLADLADGGGLRVVGRQGVRVGGDLYIASGLMVGERVLVRHDPTDMGRIYCFSPDGETFLAEAICPETAGVDRAAAVSAARRAQQRQIAEETAAIRREARRIKPRDMADTILKAGEGQAAKLVEFPKKKEPHVTPQIEAAAQAQRQKPLPPSVPMSPRAAEIQAEDIAVWKARRAGQKAAPPPDPAMIKEMEKNDRALRQFDVEGRIQRGEPVTEEEAKWLERYRNEAEYRMHLWMYEEFAEKWLSDIRGRVARWQAQKSGVVGNVVASE